MSSTAAPAPSADAKKEKNDGAKSPEKSGADTNAEKAKKTVDDVQKGQAQKMEDVVPDVLGTEGEEGYRVPDAIKPDVLNTLKGALTEAQSLLQTGAVVSAAVAAPVPTAVMGAGVGALSLAERYMPGGKWLGGKVRSMGRGVRDAALWLPRKVLSGAKNILLKPLLTFAKLHAVPLHWLYVHIVDFFQDVKLARKQKLAAQGVGDTAGEKLSLPYVIARGVKDGVVKTANFLWNHKKALAIAALIAFFLL